MRGVVKVNTNPASSEVLSGLEKGRGFHHPLLVGSFVISAAVFILYSVALGHNFLFDEENIILRNPLIRNLGRLQDFFGHGYFYFEGRPLTDWAQYYRPLTSLTFAVDYRFWKLDPFGYNLTNTFLHGAVSVLLFLFLVKALKDKRAAFLAALLYSIHTIHTEAVTYIASRGDLLGGALILATLLCYWRLWFGRALFFGVLALFVKESAVLLPVYILILDVSFIKSGRRNLLIRLAPFVAAAAAYLIFRRFFSPVPLGPPVNDLQMAVLRVLSMGSALLAYFQALALPEIFKFCESIRFAGRFTDPQVAKTIFVFSLLGAGWLLSLRHRGAVFFGMSLFLVSLLPYFHVVHFFPEWAEHYLYIASMGLAVLLGCLINKILETGSRRLIFSFLALYLLFFSFLCQRTWQRNALYNDSVKYYARLAQSDSPYAFYGYQNLARLAMEEGNWAAAIVPLKVALAIEPRSDVTENLVGLYYFEKGQNEEAIRHFDKAYRNSNREYRYLINVGIGLIRLGKYEEAGTLLEDIQSKIPRYLSVYTNLVAAYELAGKPDTAAAWADKGMEALEARKTDLAVLTMAAARMAYRQGQEDLMARKLDLILEKYPDVFWYGDLARLLRGRTTPDEFLEIVRLKYPAFEATAQFNVLVALSLEGQWDRIPRFIQTNKEAIEKQVRSHPLVRREWKKVVEAMEAHGLKPLHIVD